MGSEELHFKLKHSFENLDYKACEEGESNTECQGRANKFLLNLQKFDGDTVIVSHGNFIAALLSLNAENRAFGYEEMCSLSNPDVFILNYDYDSKLLLSFNRIWNNSICGLDIKDRISARAIILNASMDSVLLFHFYNKDTICLGKAAKSIWITPGGGVEPDEELVLSLERELNEELGLIPSDYTLKGHLWRSDPKPTIYKNSPFMFIDNYFVIRLNHSCDSFDFSKWTDEEKSVLKNLKWWYLIDLKTTSDLVVPPQLRSFDVTVLQHPIELTQITEDI
jgi:8-oxo-dGTP pyrophosphatase MutT (NUDIX family)